MMFMASFRKTIFSGDPANLERISLCFVSRQMSERRENLNKYSKVNQATLVVSIKDRMGFSTKFPFRS